MSKRRSKLKIILIALLIAVVIGGIGVLAALFLMDKSETGAAASVTEEMRDAIVLPDVDNPEPPDFSELQRMNADIVAWLTLDGTDVNHPIVQSSDNEYYLTRSAKKTKSMYGALFLDYRLHKDFSDPNNIIYGHNMRDDAMFGALMPFKDKAFFDSHKTGWLYTPEKNYRLNIFAVSVGHDYSNAYTWVFQTENVFDAFIEQINLDALFQREEPIAWGNQVLTMSTCSYEFENARTVVYAVMKP
jgi:sortase, SrtB family